MIHPLDLVRSLSFTDPRRLADTADRFRRAIEAVGAATAEAEYPHDPDTSAGLLLHRFLSEMIPSNTWFFVSGERYQPRWRSHAWVQCGDLIIDITGTALGAKRSTVVTSNRTWHAQFSVTDKRHRPYGDYEDRSTRERLDAGYARILAALATSVWATPLGVRPAA